MNCASFSRSGYVFRLALVGAAVVLAVGFAARRHLYRQRLLMENERRIQTIHRMTPWEFMAAGEGHAFLQRKLGKLKYPNSVYRDDPDQPVEVFCISTDKPAVVADYFAKEGKLKVAKTSLNGGLKFNSHTKIDGHNVKIQVSAAPDGSVIQYSLPDMRPPTGQ